LKSIQLLSAKREYGKGRRGPWKIQKRRPPVFRFTEKYDGVLLETHANGSTIDPALYPAGRFPKCLTKNLVDGRRTRDWLLVALLGSRFTERQKVRRKKRSYRCLKSHGKIVFAFRESHCGTENKSVPCRACGDEEKPASKRGSYVRRKGHRRPRRLGYVEKRQHATDTHRRGGRSERAGGNTLVSE